MVLEPAPSTRRVFRIVAHRGDTTFALENTMAGFQHALEIGADGLELDVRLTRDGLPAVYHYFYLEEATTGAGPIFNRTAAELRNVAVKGAGPREHAIPMLVDVLEQFGGRILLEIEVKGPEREAAEAIAGALRRFPGAHPRVEVTSWEPAQLLAVRRFLPAVSTALLVPRSEPWMKLDVVAYAAVHRARIAEANAVHLHPSQLNLEVASRIRTAGMDVHSWEVNDVDALQLMADLEISWFDTDRVEAALTFRNSLSRLARS